MSYYLTSWTSKVDLSSNIYLVNNEFYFIEEKDKFSIYPPHQMKYKILKLLIVVI